MNILTLFLSSGGGGAVGGLLVAGINGFFIRKNNDIVWRSKHLAKDKKVVRNLINNLNAKYLDNLNEEKFNIISNNEVLQEIEKLRTYLDINNPMAQNLYKLYCQLYTTIKSLDLEYNQILDDHNEYELHLNDYPEFVRIKCARNNLAHELKDTIGKYFVYYYPKK